MSQNKDKSKNPRTTCASYDAMYPSWSKVQTVLDGTAAMRAAEKQYLPQHAEESDATYVERKERATLLNMTALTLGSWVGRPFSEPIKTLDVPPELEALFENVDLLGNDLQVFCREWFKDGLAKAYSHCYVDYPRTEGPRTLAQNRSENVRPYLIHYRPEQVFFTDVQIVDGKEMLQEVRIIEDVVERNGFAEVVKPQIRRVFMSDGVVTIELYQPKDTKKQKRDWVVVDEYTITLPRIPMITFYADRSGPMLGKPPLEDLADLNISHWQSSSDQRACLTVARFPILAASGGVDDNEQLSVGPNKWLWMPDAQGRFYYVEHSGAALAAGRQDMLDSETQMAEYGAEFLKKKPQKTATERVMDTAEATSPLMDVTLRFNSSLAEVLKLLAEWMSLKTGGSVLVHSDFGDETTTEELRLLSEARKMRDISREAYLGELQLTGVLSQDYDIEKDGALLEQESMNLFGTTAPPSSDLNKSGAGEGEEEPGGES